MSNFGMDSSLGMDNFYSGEFSLDGADVFVHLEIPSGLIRAIDKPPMEPGVIAGKCPDRLNNCAIRIETANGSVFWTRGDRSWYIPKNDYFKNGYFKKAYISDKCHARGYHSIDKVTGVCIDCEKTKDEIHYSDGKGGIVRKGRATINTNTELGKRLAENL